MSNPQPGPTNALASAASAYLRSAMNQPVQWREWGSDAFAEAKRLDRPILLDIGAVWCHWCHVMDRESYENAALAAVINRNFVAIKVDRDERPDVDARYQSAVQTMAGQGGWPLTVILTSDGRPFFGGTYFPPGEVEGRPGFRRVLETLAGVWRERRTELHRTAAEVLEAVEEGESFAGHSGSLGPGLVDALAGSILGDFDREHGGFGSSPKFPHPAALDLLLDLAGRTGSSETRHAAAFTLEAMARGGMYDQLGGGFHRYSVDERWVVPHFEKMLYDNAGLLANYAHAFQSFVEPEFARVTVDMLRWMDGTLSDRERGGFYASQDADITLDDDGDYFTWTRAEVEAVLEDVPAESSLAVTYYNVRTQGDMHHNPAKCVLHVPRPFAEVASTAGLEPRQAAELLRAGHAKLLAARAQRPAPFIDRTLYTGWNAMAVSAYLAAADALERPATRDFALRTLDRLLDQGWDAAAKQLRHVVAYADGHTPARFAPAVLDDYALMIHACLDAWQATASLRYYAAAEELVASMVDRFADRANGGFFDTAQGTGELLGALRTRRKPLQDAPTPAGNPSAAAALLRLAALNDDQNLRDLAEDTLECFAGIVEQFGLYASSYGLALERLLLPPVQIVVIGEDEQARILAAAASARFAINKSVLRLKREQVRAEMLPPVLAETLPHLPQLLQAASFAVVCRGNTCQPPVTDAEALLVALQGT
ncbi:thioredoxin domain-containing protein [Acidipila sp. EB88]|uniref:thioredoxin domain-containing protein n=1 Tax=Acidipila sp. EB88 TaxID=2305226 RepID=UPI000F5DF759|nr:thioredoxin domain-containing protein [Acidipila sp. EB88]RRA49668.1 thioredoxin domain-containing protein [Acidipila sp. EB88]